MNTSSVHVYRSCPSGPVAARSRFTLGWLLSGAALAFSLLAPLPSRAAYSLRNLVSDVPGLAEVTDPNLVNPWGIAYSPSSAFWIADNHSGLATLYAGSGATQRQTVSVPPATGAPPPGAPTGIVFNNTTNFVVGGTNRAVFIFAGEDGTISAWSSGSSAVLKANNSSANAVYKGLALNSRGGNPYLYATDFHNGKVDVFDAGFGLVRMPGAFVDATIPAGFAPFGIESIGNRVLVTYAKQDADAKDDVRAPGNGFVNIFDTNGNRLQRLISNGVLNSPWGMTMAPSGFGQFGGKLLIGNFGDGTINAFDPVNGAFLGSLADVNGASLSIEGLWGLKFGNGTKAGDVNSLFFTAGIAAGGGIEDHGLFGTISSVLSPLVQHNLVSDVAGIADVTDPNLVNPWGIAFSPKGPFWIADNHSGLVTIYDGNGAPQPLVVTIPPATGAQPPGAPTGIVFNNTTNFFAAGTNRAVFIFAGEDGTISAWSPSTGARLEVSNSPTMAVYKGLALNTYGGAPYLYAADFHNGKIDVFDSNFNYINRRNSFVDPTLPAGFAPFGIESFGTQLFVTYAKQDADAMDDVSGTGNGFVNVFDTNGNLVKRLISGGVLNSPWGMTMAPIGFGQFGGKLLIGNFGDGTINAFDPVSGASLGSLVDISGVSLSIQGLWGLKFGNGAKAGNGITLYFTAGIAAGGGIEDHGLFGRITSVTTPYVQRNLVSDVAGLAEATDPNLLNPWGIAYSPDSAFWVADNHSGLASLYTGNGAIERLTVSIPPPTGAPPPGAPTGIVFNNTTNFFVNSTNRAIFIFAGEDGTLSGWSANNNAVLKADNSKAKAIYKGLALNNNGQSNYLYAADFHNAKVDVFDADFKLVSRPGAFADPTIPAGYAPFGIESFGPHLLVTYAKQDADAKDDVRGPGNGFANVFDANGNMVQRLISNSVLNSPWGMTVAPIGFGHFGGKLLIGNFGDGKINAFDPASGVFLGFLGDTNGMAISIQGLWGLKFGNGGRGGETNKLYFTAGIAAGGGIEDHGLFGSIALATLLHVTSISVNESKVTLSWTGGEPPYRIQKKLHLTDPNWVDVVTVAEQFATFVYTGGSGFFRITN